MVTTNAEINAKVAVAIMGHSPAFKRPYSTDATSDLLVLHKVRSRWDGDSLQLFLGVLFQFYTVRTKNPALLFLQYEIGDYSKAAIIALGELDAKL